MKPNYEPNIRKQVKLDLDNSEPSEFNNSIEVIDNPALQEIAQTLHNDLRDVDNECGIYDYIKGLGNINQETSLVTYPNLINLDNYPSLSKIILDSVRNEHRNLVVNENNLTVNSINLILQGILDGLNAEHPQFQGLEYLQISSNSSNVGNVAMNEESMNLLSDIILHPNNQIKNLDIRNNNIEPANLNIFLGKIANNQDLQELDFSNNFINQSSVEILNSIFENNPNIKIEAEYSVPQNIELGNLIAQPRFERNLELEELSEEISASRLTPSTSSGLSRASSLSSFSSYEL